MMIHLKSYNVSAVAALALLLITPLLHGQAPATVKLNLPPGVEKLCSIPFEKDARRPTRVQDDALSCLQDVAARLKSSADHKLVLVGVADPVKDHEGTDKGKERDAQDMSGLDTRYDDIAAYRAVNAKAYLVKWLGISSERLIPTTNESRKGQDVAFYLVPADADFLHNYLNTTRTNEDPCTVKPCYDPREESLDPQPRAKILAPGKPASSTKSTTSSIRKGTQHEN